MKKINAKPLDTYSTFEIDESKLKQMYYGSLDQCRCGCGGDYHKPGEPRSADQMKINAGFALFFEGGFSFIPLFFSILEYGKNQINLSIQYWYGRR